MELQHGDMSLTKHMFKPYHITLKPLVALKNHLPLSDASSVEILKRVRLQRLDGGGVGHSRSSLAHRVFRVSQLHPTSLPPTKLHLAIACMS